MIYYVFSALFLIGAVAAAAVPVFLYRKREVRILESSEKVNCRDGEFRNIQLRHAIEAVDEPGKVYITDVIPVHEPDGAKVKVKFERNGEPVKRSAGTVPSVLMFLSMAGAGGLCLVMGLSDSKMIALSKLPVLTSGNIAKTVVFIAAAAFFCLLVSDVIYILSPGVVKVKGKYEGYMHATSAHRLSAYYSLWYGEFKQYARCPGASIRVKADDKEHTLFYNTSTGTVKRKADILVNVCLGIIFAAAFLLLYFKPF